MSRVARRRAAVIATVTVLCLGGATAGCEEYQPPADEPASVGDTDSSTRADDRPNEDDRAGEPQGPSEPDQSTTKKKTHLVVHVVDGDTLDLGNGRRVRLAGIDAPEVGQCGYKRARNALSRLVLGQRVRLVASDEEQDQYGRLLKYVDVGKTDAGLALIKAGLAIARYDSRDGYGFHPREPRYIKADRASAPYACAPQPVPFAGRPAAKKQGKNCAPGYSPCVRAHPPDLDCADIGHPVQVTGSDPHGLDRDRDGVACEWS